MYLWSDWRYYEQPFFWDIYSSIINFLGVYQTLGGMEIFFQSPFETIWTFLLYLYAAIINVSGPIWHFTIPAMVPYEQVFIFYAIVMVFALIFDFFTLSAVSRRNVQKRSEKPSYNKSFAAFFVFARLWLMDIFLFSSLGARISNMNLSKKQIIWLIIVTQCIRIAISVILYFQYYDITEPSYYKWV